MSNARLEQAVAREALEAAHGARSRGDLEVALEHLLAAWAAVRDPSLGDCVDIVSHAARDLRPPVSDESQWLRRTREADAVELGRLLEKLPRRQSLLIPGLEALMDRGPDPRLAAAIMRTHRRLPTWLMARAAMRPHLDPVYLPALRDLAAGAHDEARREALAASIDDHEALARLRATQLDAGGRDWVERIMVAQAELPELGDSREHELLAEIAGAPESRAARAVYADFLVQRGELYGEFIALQLRDEQGQLDASGRARMEALIEAHGREWLGALAQVLEPGTIEFRAGFGWRALLVGPGGGPLPEREASWLASHPGLVTFAELDGAPEGFGL